MSEDSLWPRAANWISEYLPQDEKHSGESALLDFGLVGVPAHATSISATGANHTPAAVRQALARYSTWSWQHEIDLGQLTARDFGDSAMPDSSEGEERTAKLVGEATRRTRLVVVIGGDNSVTFAAMRGATKDLKRSGLITFDAHHDIRDGVSNGSPVRRLIEAGLPGNQVVQVGIADFSNSPEYAKRALDLGIHVIPRSDLRSSYPGEIWQRVLSHLTDVDEIFVDIDVDVCDRSVVPACPAAAPGGLNADELRQFAFLAASEPRVVALDITEIDATNDAPDQRTIRLAALLILEAAAGLASRS